jgi:hypothetical protein
MQHRIGLLAAALWWGSLTTLGFLVVPLLFAHLGSPAAAGAMAAKLFSAQTWVSLGLGLFLLAVLRPKDPEVPASRSSVAIGLVAAGMLLAILVEFAVAPRIVSARSTGGDLRLWHGVGSAMYLGQWVCSLVLLWRETSGPKALGHQE